MVKKSAPVTNNQTAPSAENTFERLSRLSDISMSLALGLPYEEFLKTVAKSLKDALKADETSFYLLDNDSFELVLTAFSGPPRQRPGRIKCPERRQSMSSSTEFGFPPCPPNGKTPVEEKESAESGLIRKAFTNLQRLIFTREIEDPVFDNVPFYSCLIIPLKANTQVVGVMIVANTRSRRSFNVNDMEEANVFANLGAFATEHGKLIDDRENRIREMEKLNVLAKRFSTVQTLEGLIGLSFEYLSHLIPHELGLVSLFNNDEETRYFVCNRPLSPRSVENLTRHVDEISLKLREQPPKIVRCQQIFLPAKEAFSFGTVFKSKIHSFLTVPLTVQGRNIGMINLSAIKPSAFSRDHLRTFGTLSNLLATAVENVKIRLFLEQRIEQVSVLFEISQSISSTLVLNEVLDSIVNFSMEMMHALRCELRLLDACGKHLEIRASRGLSQSFLGSTPIKVGEGIIGSVVSQKLPISVVDARKDPRTRHLKIVKREKLAGLLAVPILQRSKPIGVITVYTSKPRDFSQNEIDLLSTFASQASIAIENARLYQKMKDQYLSMVMALAAAIEAKDTYTHGHSQKVMDYAVKIAKMLELPEEEVETIRYAGLLHDIGKIGIKDMILTKQGALTTEEREELHNHPKYGALIMERVEMLKDIAPLTLYHHERYDGTGYPLGLKGEQIPIGARILAVADTFDSMIADRPYRKAFSYSYVINEIRKVTGTQLDPELVKIFLDILKDEERSK